jgi:hypothetical protein
MPLIDALHQMFACTIAAPELAGAIAMILFLLIYAGVILPAVWSRRPYRRLAALRTLVTLLDHLEALVRALRRSRVK